MHERVKLSKRLKTVATFVSKGAYLADIGSDHGYLPCYICQHDDDAKAIASEVRKGPFLRTKETVEHYQLSERIDVRLGDGLSVLTEQDPITDIVIAGMGGSLITQILTDGKSLLRYVNKIIVQPNNNAQRIRKFFIDNQLTLTSETILEENNQIYEILVAETKKLQSPYDDTISLEKQLFFGPFLMSEKSAVFKKKWQFEKEKITKILIQLRSNEAQNVDKIKLFQNQLHWIEEALK